MNDLSLEEIKELLKEYPLKKDRKIVAKILEGEKLSENELVRAFHISMSLFTLKFKRKSYIMGFKNY